ncbi:RHS repeat-associated core domain-containing protein [Paenibacillus ihumii]|uniref:RHS repeat-associated core domain-containing protein n=1 Tax=Paenibacillus ihumii TaxID=687436 RepID=UPI0006D8255D|nr:RHS repeat-associated core domain-containing protein [Paenibacillus ihumii]
MKPGIYLSYHSDLRGSTTLLTDEQGRVRDRYTYDPYGKIESHEGDTRQPFQYNGRDGVMTDPNGLYYMRARYYHPVLKRFLNRDVIRGDLQDGQTFNRYAYVNGDPVRYIDPLGLMKQQCSGGGKGEGPFVPDDYWKRDAPKNSTPGDKITHNKYNERTGELEKSTVIYDSYGRQQYRVDNTNHGYSDHSNPHLHETKYGPKYDPQYGYEKRYDFWMDGEFIEFY